MIAFNVIVIKKSKPSANKLRTTFALVEPTHSLFFLNIEAVKELSYFSFSTRTFLTSSNNGLAYFSS